MVGLSKITFPVQGGPAADYSGGWVWKTAGEAQAYLASRNSEHNRRVYGLIADWETDTVEVAGQPTRCLIREARVVRLT